MRKTISMILAAVICFVMLAGCGAKITTNGNARIITDGAGREVEVPEKTEADSQKAIDDALADKPKRRRRKKVTEEDIKLTKKKSDKVKMILFRRRK